MKKIAPFLFAFTALLGFISNSFAQEDSIGMAFSIDSLVLLHAASPQVGDTVYFVIHGRAFGTGPGWLALNFPGGIAPPDRVPGQTQRLDSIALDSGQDESFSVPLKLFEYGVSAVEVFIEPGWNRSLIAYGWIAISFSVSSFAYSTSNPPLFVRNTRSGAFLSAYPNPFYDRTTITWGTEMNPPLNLFIYDDLGRRRLVESGLPAAGSYDLSSESFSGGTYTAILQAGRESRIFRLTIIH